MPDEREVDPQLQRRRLLAERGLAILDSESGADPVDHTFLFQVWSELGSWLSGFLDSLGNADAARDEGSDVIERLRELRHLGDVLLAGSRLRPWLPLWEVVDSLVDSLFNVARRYLAAISADTPLEAQRLAAAAQDAIDASAVIADEAADLVDFYARLAEATTEEEAVSVLAERAASRAGAATILDLEADGNLLYREMMGGTGEVPVGLGLLFACIDAQATATLDRRRLWAVAQAATSIMRADRARFETPEADADLLADIREASLFLFEASRTMHVMVQAARLERHEVEALLTFGHTLIEGPIRRYLALLAAVLKGQPYSKFRGKDASRVLDIVRQAGQATITDGLPKAVRHAVAHKDYRIEESPETTHVILQEGSTKNRRNAVELADDVLLALETALALQVAVSTAVGLARGSVDDLAVELGFTPEAQINMVMEFAGWTDVETTIAGSEAIIEARCTLGPESIREAGMVVTQLPTSVEVLIARSTDADGQPVELTVPLAPLRSYSASDDLEKDAWFIEAARRATLNDKPILTREHVRKWLAVQAAQSTGAVEPGRTRRLKALLRLARRLADTEAAEALRDMISVARANEFGLPAADAERASLATLATWVSLEAPEVFERLPG